MNKFRTAFDLLVRFGPSAFFEEFVERLGFRGRYTGSVFPDSLVTEYEDNPAVLHDISVVVPVRSFDSDLDDLLDSLNRQKGCNLQVLLVLSGPSDRTVDPSDYGFRIQIIHDETGVFSHSRSRNLGIQSATYPSVFVTVQDARIPTPVWLAQLSTLREQMGVVALSVAETPRSDADLYARYAISTFRKSLAIDKAISYVHEAYRGDRQSRNSLVALNNVGTLYDRDTLLKYRFRGEFGEDLDLGLRLLRVGMRTGRTGCLEIVHSHNRTAYYWMRRQFASRRFLNTQGLGDNLHAQESDIAKGIVPGFFYQLAARLGDELSIVNWVKAVDSELAMFLSYWNCSPTIWRQNTDFKHAAEDFLALVDNSVQIPSDELDRALLKALSAKLGWLLGGVTSTGYWARNLSDGV